MSQQSKLSQAFNSGVVSVRKSLRCAGEVVVKFPDAMGISDILLGSFGVVVLTERKNVTSLALKQSNLSSLVRAGHVEIV